MRKTEIRVERSESFFDRGRRVARIADRGGPMPSSRVVAFEDMESLLHVLSERRIHLLRQVQEEPGSIAGLARKLHRDRSAVARDVHVLERFGVIQVTEKPLPGHGTQKWVAPVARSIELTARL